MDSPPKHQRPPVRKLVQDLVLLAAIVAGTHLLDSWTHNNLIVVGAVALVAGGAVAWWFLSYWRSMGWI
jgi:hypothetical protein